MFFQTCNRSVASGLALAFCVALLVGCASSADDGTDGSSPTTETTSVSAARAPVASKACAEAVSAIAHSSADDHPTTLEVDILGLAVPQSCRDLADLRSAAKPFGPEGSDGVADFVIRSCVAGDSWPLLGEPSVIADTTLCKEARSQYTLVGNRRLVSAQATFEDDFDGPCRQWSTDRDERVVMSCTDGAYRVLVRNPDRPQHSRLFDGEPRARLSVEADVVLMKPERGTFEAHGVTCWGSPTLGYVFAIGPDASYAIVRVSLATGKQEILKLGDTNRALPGARARNRIRGDCEVAAGGARLTVFVNGDRIAAARDDSAPPSFIGFGVFVKTSEPGTDVRFDNVLVRGDES